MKPTLLILAAGMGSRYGGLKQMDGVGPSGETIIDYSIYDAIRAGFGKLVFVIRGSFEADFKKGFTERLGEKIELAFVNQELNMIPEPFVLPSEREKPWGTAHAVLVARDLIKEPFAVINADDFYGASSYRLLVEFLASAKSSDRPEHSLVGYRLSNTLSDHGAVSRGVCGVNEKNLLTRIDERKGVEREGASVRYIDGDSFGQLGGDEIVSMNMWGFMPSIFDQIENTFVRFLSDHLAEPKSECYIPDVIEQMTAAGEGQVRVIQSEEDWFGVTYQEDRPKVVKKLRQLVADKIYPDNLWG